MLRRILTTLEKRVLPDYFVERTQVAFGMGFVREPASRRLFNFDEPESNARWTTTADAQLGGLSDVQLEFTEDHTALFTGSIRRMPRRLIEIGKLRRKQSIIEENRERIRQLEALSTTEASDCKKDQAPSPSLIEHHYPEHNDVSYSPLREASRGGATPSPQGADYEAPLIQNSLESVAIGGSSPHQDLPQTMSGLIRPGNVVRVEPHETSTISHWRAGYAAMRYKFPHFMNLELFEAFEIKYKGDGRLYTINIRPASFAGRPEVYQLPIRTIEGKWMVTRVPFTSLARTFRGFITEEQGGFNPSKMLTLSVVLKDDWEGEFSLEVDYIDVISDLRYGNFKGQRFVANRRNSDYLSYPH